MKTKHTYINSSSNQLDIILQGGSYGIESEFMQKVIKTCSNQGHRVLAFNFPYHERGEEHSSGPELKEEIETLKKYINKYDAGGVKHIRFVAKSLGAVVASYFLKTLPKEEQRKFSIVVLGYLPEYVELENFLGRVDVIQGEYDKHGNIKNVKKHLKNAVSKQISYFEVKGGDHSFCDPDTKKPLYQDEAIEILASRN